MSLLQLPATAAAADSPVARPLPGRFVRVASGTSKEELHCSELEVIANNRNVALRKPVQASSIFGDFKPEMAVDGVVEYAWGKDASFWTSSGKGDQWWEVDLGKEQPIDRIVQAVFQPQRRVEQLTIVSERGSELVLANPFRECRVRLGGKVLLTTGDRLLRLPTRKGDTLTFAEAAQLQSSTGGNP